MGFWGDEDEGLLVVREDGLGGGMWMLVLLTVDDDGCCESRWEDVVIVLWGDR